MSDLDSTRPVRAGIIVTGNEVLNATIADSNGPWISERIGELGLEVAYVLTVGDREDDLLRALEFFAADGVELVVTSGGLGPTADDLTAEVVARFTEREMALDVAMEEKIAAILARYARRAGFDPEALLAANRKQAMVPRGAIAMDPVGTAPGLVVPGESQVVIVLPGPPRELRPMWDVAVTTEPVRSITGRATALESRRLRLFGLPESEIAKSLREIEAGGVEVERVEVTTCLRKGELEVDLRWRSDGAEAAQALATELAARHSDELFSSDGTTVDEVVADLLRGRRLALAESCTGGLLAARITSLAGASEYFPGSVVSYSNEAKTEMLGVEAGLIERHGAVSAEVAEAMARGALESARADTAVAITGIAGPHGGTPSKPVGYVCFHARTSDGREIARDPVIPGGRSDVRERSALVAMHMLRRLLN